MESNYEKLVKALRECASDDPDCIYNCPYYNHDVCADDLKSDAAAAIEELQAEVERLEPKRGEWIEENRRPRSSKFVCSECHRTAYDPQPTRDKAWRKRCRYAYCPNCGAKMEVQDG